MRKTIPKKIRQQVYDKYNGHCAYCGCELEYKDMQVDHIEAVYRAEINGRQADESIDNYMPACRMCNFYKSTYPIDFFREMLGGIPERLQKVFIFRLAIKYGLIEIKDKPIRFYFEMADKAESEDNEAHDKLKEYKVLVDKYNVANNRPDISDYVTVTLNQMKAERSE